MRIDADEVQFSLLQNEEKIGIYLYIPGYDDTQIVFRQIGYLFLDDALGEFDVEMKVGLIKMFPPEKETEFDRYPLVKLPEIFDRLTAEIGLDDPRA